MDYSTPGCRRRQSSAEFELACESWPSPMETLADRIGDGTGLALALREACADAELRPWFDGRGFADARGGSVAPRDPEGAGDACWLGGFEGASDAWAASTTRRLRSGTARAVVATWMAQAAEATPRVIVDRASTSARRETPRSPLPDLVPTPTGYDDDGGGR